VAARAIPYYMVPYGIGALLYAPLARRISLKIIMAFSMAGYGLLSLLCVFMVRLNPFLWAQVVLGLSAASVVPLGLITIGRLFEYQIRGRLVGTFFSSSFLSSFVGVWMSGFADWRWLFSIPALLGFLPSASYFLIPFSWVNRLEAKRIDYVGTLKQPDIRNVFIFIFFISLFFHAVHKWFGVYLSRIYHCDQKTISLFFILMALSSIMGQMLGGFLTDKKGRLQACLLGVFLLSFSTVALALRLPLYTVALIFAFFSMGWTIGHNGVSTVLTDFPDENRPEIASLNSSLRFLSGGLGFFISGLFIEKSFGLTFLGFGILMLISSVFLKKIIPYQQPL
jgi:predicted MFS family arabinose efflux permease